MNAKFFDLKKEKQDRMINAALKVFALNGYLHAGTDEIVREAGISKGLLFHYFESKLGVYSFVYEYSARYMTLELAATATSRETDPFTLLAQVKEAEMHAMRGYPYMVLFLRRARREDVGEALLAVEEKRHDLEVCYGAIYERMDLSCLGKQDEAARIFKSLTLTLEGLLEEHFADGSFQPEMYYEECEEYIALFQKLVTGTESAK